ncbi:30S ribosomal protein S10 [Patescibacteria group bacterium]|jgi:small subunit ribosomal protein S10|nr:30S ribosomal protein S10 [Patescibacteria group bacterium]
MPAKAKSSSNPKLRIKLKSYDLKMLESSLGKVTGLLVKSGADVKGPIPLPSKKKIYTVIRSNFKHNESREQYERITYTRLIDVTNMGSKTMEYLQNIAIPVGVMVDVKVF